MFVNVYLIISITFFLLAGCIILWDINIIPLWVKLIMTICAVYIPIAIMLYSGNTKEKYGFIRHLKQEGLFKTFWIMFKVGFYKMIKSDFK